MVVHFTHTANSYLLLAVEVAVLLDVGVAVLLAVGVTVLLDVGVVGALPAEFTATTLMV